MSYREPLRVLVKKDEKRVSLSIRTSDQKVEVFSLPISEFQKMVNDFNAQMK